MGETFLLMTGVAGLTNLCLEVAAISHEYVHVSEALPDTLKNSSKS